MDTIEVTYEGSPELVGQFVRYLEAEGAEVEWEPPYEQRGASEVVQAAVVTMTVYGTRAMIEAARSRFRERWPKAEIDWREDDAYR